jgi:hypothetical protein
MAWVRLLRIGHGCVSRPWSGERVSIRLGPLFLAMIALVVILVGIQSVIEVERTDKDLPGVSSSVSMAAPNLLVERPPESSRLSADEQAPIEATSFSALHPQEVVARMIAQIASGDAQLRAVAIGELAKAPKLAALPVLRDVLNGGEPGVDRPLALRALRDLALYQGDDDGAIRGAVREAIYHGDDEAFSLSAQEALEIIEESEM